MGLTKSHGGGGVGGGVGGVGETVAKLIFRNVSEGQF